MNVKRHSTLNFLHSTFHFLLSIPHETEKIEEEVDKVLGLELGADDYMTKPFDLDELLVRIEAVLRRYSGKTCKEAQAKVLKFKNLILDVTVGTASVCGNMLTLTGKEFAILELMLDNPTKLWSKANLFESIWGDMYLGDDNTIKVHMSNIRSKIKKFDAEQEYIETVWGMGYRLVN